MVAAFSSSHGRSSTKPPAAASLFSLDSGSILIGSVGR
jgi:hypothetical protein